MQRMSSPELRERFQVVRIAIFWVGELKQVRVAESPDFRERTENRRTSVVGEALWIRIVGTTFSLDEIASQLHRMAVHSQHAAEGPGVSKRRKADKLHDR